MATLDQKSEKQHLKLAVFGSTDSGKSTLCAAITKTLGCYQRDLQKISANKALNWGAAIIQDGNDNLAPNFTFETSQNLITIFGGHSWYIQYEEFLEKSASTLTGAIFILSLIEGFDAQISILEKYSIKPLVIFLNKTDVASEFQNEKSNQSGNWNKKLQKYYGESIPIIEGSALNALESPNIDISTPEYQPIIDLIQAIDIKK